MPSRYDGKSVVVGRALTNTSPNEAIFIAARRGMRLHVEHVWATMSVPDAGSPATTDTETLRVQATDGTNDYDIITPQVMTQVGAGSPNNPPIDKYWEFTPRMTLPENFGLQWNVSATLLNAAIQVMATGWWVPTNRSDREGAASDGDLNQISRGDIVSGASETALIPARSGKRFVVTQLGFSGSPTTSGGIIDVMATDEGSPSATSNSIFRWDFDQTQAIFQVSEQHSRMHLELPMGYGVTYTGTNCTNTAGVFVAGYYSEEGRSDKFTGVAGA